MNIFPHIFKVPYVSMELDIIPNIKRLPRKQKKQFIKIHGREAYHNLIKNYMDLPEGELLYLDHRYESESRHKTNSNK